MSVPTVSESVVSKAVRMLEQRRVDVIGPDRAIVRGDNDDYIVKAFPDGLGCSCPAGQHVPSRCSHALAALLAFHAKRVVEAGYAD